jgi:hypothetical protein
LNPAIHSGAGSPNRSWRTMSSDVEATTIARSAASFVALRPALRWLDERLVVAIERAQSVYGATAATDRFRGLYITDGDVERMLAREPGAGAFVVDGDGAAAAYPTITNERLDRLVDAFSLTSFDVAALIIALGPALDSRYERLYAYLQDDVARRRPSVDLLLTLLCDSAEERAARRAHFLADAPLVQHRLVHVVAEPAVTSSLLASSLVVDEQIVHFLLGHDALDARLSTCCEMVEPGTHCWPGCALGPEEMGRLQQLVLEAHHCRESLRLWFHGTEGIGKRTTAAAVARRAGLPLLRLNLSAIAASAEPAVTFGLAPRGHGQRRASTVTCSSHLDRCRLSADAMSGARHSHART